MTSRINIIGSKFGRLLVVEELEKRSVGKRIMYKCVCDCGKSKSIEGSMLRIGDTKSCGCLKREILLTHGLTNTRIYRIWSSMLGRCNTESNSPHKHYGGRGITVCEEWHKFENFYEWSLNNGYNEALTIDRIDTNGNYETSNCRWATKKQQDRNKRNSINVEINGKIFNLKDLSDVYGIPYSTLRGRYINGVRGVSLISPRYQLIKFKEDQE